MKFLRGLLFALPAVLAACGSDETGAGSPSADIAMGGSEERDRSAEPAARPPTRGPRSDGPGASTEPADAEVDPRDAAQDPAKTDDQDPGKTEDSDFIRFVETGDHEGGLETTISKYRNADGVEVDLIAVVHIGDEDYYQGLNETFESYDSVLYEMVAPEGTDPARAGRSGNPVSVLQRMFCAGLGLAFQLDEVDYGADNFVHADLTTEGFARVWEEKNMNFFKLALEIMSSSLGSQGSSKLTPQAMFDAVRSKNRKQRLKFLIGREFSNIEKMFSGGGPSGENETLLIGERNKAALEVMVERIAKGDRELCLFYGAGHMPDFELRMIRDHGFDRVGHEWRTAWRVAGK